MIEAFFAIPGELATPTGGYAYDRKVLAHIGAFGVRLHHLPLPGGFPGPSDAELQKTAAVLQGLPENAVVLIDGLAYGAFTPALLAQIRQNIIALVHHPLGLETGLSPGESERLLKLEGGALAGARRIIVTSATTAATVRELFGVAQHLITVAPPGLEKKPRPTQKTGTLRLVSAGAVVPRKGHDVLVEALAALAGLEWCCTIAGSLDRDAATAVTLRALIHRLGLDSRVELVGALSQDGLDALYQSGDIFVLASRYEGYGMVFAEAMAHGLPVVATTAGAIPETVPPQAGMLVRPDDAAGLATALQRMLMEPELRRAYGSAAWDYAQSLPGWEAAAMAIADAIKKVAATEVRA